MEKNRELEEQACSYCHTAKRAAWLETRQITHGRLHNIQLLSSLLWGRGPSL